MTSARRRRRRGGVGSAWVFMFFSWAAACGCCVDELARHGGVSATGYPPFARHLQAQSDDVPGGRFDHRQDFPRAAGGAVDALPFRHGRGRLGMLAGGPAAAFDQCVAGSLEDLHSERFISLHLWSLVAGGRLGRGVDAVVYMATNQAPESFHSVTLSVAGSGTPTQPTSGEAGRGNGDCFPWTSTTARRSKLTRRLAGLADPLSRTLRELPSKR